MGIYESGKANGATEASGKTKEQVQEELDSYNNKILKNRERAGTVVSKVQRPTSRSLMRSAPISPLADEFTLIGALPTIDPARPNPIPIAFFEDTGNENDYLLILIPEWADTLGGLVPDGPSQDEVFIFFNGVQWSYNEEEGDIPYRVDYPVPPETVFPIQIYITPQMLARQPEGPVQISYMVWNNSQENTDFSLAQTITIDRFQPSRNANPGQLGVPAGTPAPGPDDRVLLTREFLEANASVLFPVPPYVVARRGDVINVFLENQETPLFTSPLWPAADNTILPGVSIPSSILLGLNNGTRSLAYTLTDYEGNVSGLSQPRAVMIQLALEPGNLEAPIVATPINREQARAGVAIDIPDFPNALPTDQVEVSWVTPSGTRTLPRFPFSQRTTSVDWAFLANPDPRAVYDGTVTYTIHRGTDTFGPSPAADVAVDLSVIGPVNPDEPDPVNRYLELLRVRGAVSATDNLIDQRDVDADGTIFFPVYTDAEPGHVVRFTYGTVELTPERTLTAVEIAAGVVEVRLPWATIQAVGNGSIPAFYRIFETADAVNFQQSRNSFVTVLAITQPTARFVAFSHASIIRQNQRPGSPINATGIINCRVEPWRGVDLKVTFEPGELELQDQVTFHWVFSTGQLGEAEVDETRTQVSAFVSEAQRLINEVSVRIPYDPVRFGESVGARPPVGAPPVGVPPAVIGSVVCYFTLRRGANVYLSEKTMVKYNSLQGGRVCLLWPVTP